MSVTIKSLVAYKEFDSRGDSTLGGKLVLSDGREIFSSVSHHANIAKKPVEYLETDKAVKYLNELIAPKLVNVNPLEYEKIDAWLDKIDQTDRKEVIGVSTTLLVSKLIYQAGALISNVPLYQYLAGIFKKHFYTLEVRKLPIPIFNLISGGQHGSSNLNFQEFAIIFSSSLKFSDAAERGAALHHELEKVFEYRHIFSGVGNDGSYIPNLSSNYDALEIIKEAILKNGYKIGLDIFFALDVAAGFFYKGSKYYLSEELGAIDTAKMIEFYDKIMHEYRFLILEDPLVENDTQGWKKIVEKFGDRAYILGDDLLMSSSSKLQKAAKDKTCSLADLKISLLPTVWKAFEFVSGAKKFLLKTVVSHASLETNDTFLSDFAVGVQADYVKFGPPVRGERVAKYNRLLTIEREFGAH